MRRFPMINLKTKLVQLCCLFCGFTSVVFVAKTAKAAILHPIVDTGQTACYDNYRQIPCPSNGGAFWGQDGNYRSNPPSYRDNGDGTVTEKEATGLMWMKNASLLLAITQ
jgi:hypothetical protein